MGEFSYIIRHIPGGENYWGGLLSRLRSVDGGAAESEIEAPVCIRTIADVTTRFYVDYFHEHGLSWVLIALFSSFD